jgi:hypothetical protein
MTPPAPAPGGQEGEVSAQLNVAEALCTAAGAGAGGVILSRLAGAGVAARPSYVAVFAVTLAVALAGIAVAPRLRAR